MQRRSFIAAGGCWFAASLLAERSATGAEREVLAVIVAPHNPLTDLALHQLRRLYLGDPVLGPDDKRLVPLSQAPRSPARIGFDKAVLNMDPEEVTRYWIDRKIRGQSGPPKSIDSPDLLQRVVARLPGAIGYARAGEVRSDVKVVRIDGKLPNEAGYRVVY